METIEVVIRIPKQVYEHINVWKDIVYDDYIAMVTNAILNGTVLPKGHGDLKDANYMKREGIINRGNYNSIKGVREWVDEAPTIIKADEDSE